jgi:HSP20 family protein
MASTIDVKKSAPAPTSPAMPPADPWGSFRDEMDRLFDRFSGAFGMPSLRRMFGFEPAFRSGGAFSFATPSVDVAEDDKAFTITAEMPGLEAQDIDVTISGDMLILKGEKRQEKEEKETNYYMSERAYGAFQRSFALPEGVDRDGIAADLAKGVLRITLPKTAAAQKPAKKIEVKTAA